MLHLKVVEGGLAKAVSLDASGVDRPLRMKALRGGKYGVTIPVEGEPMASFPPGYMIQRVGDNLVVAKDGQEVLALTGFFALQPMPEFRLEYDDELRLISPETIDGYPTHGVLFDSFAAEPDAEDSSPPQEDDDKSAAWLLGLAGVGGLGLGAALTGGGGGSDKDGARGSTVPDVEGRPEPALSPPGVPEMDNGVVNAAEAADGTIVQIPGYLGMRAGDVVSLNWNGTVLIHVVTVADVAAGRVEVLVPVEEIGPDGSFQVDYTVSEAGARVLGKSPAATVVIDRVVPGAPGVGIDNPGTAINENLATPIVDEMGDGIVDANEAADGTLVRIPGYANMEVGDTVRLTWNGTTIEHTVSVDDLALGEVRVPVPAERLGADGNFRIDYTVTDRSGNVSGVSPSIPVELDRLSGGPGSPTDKQLAAPIVDEMKGDNVIDPSEAVDGTLVRIPGYAGMTAGDTIRLNWNGTVIDHVVTAAHVAGGEVQIAIDATLLANGAFDIHYIVIGGNGNHSSVSPSAPVLIAPMAPPTIDSVSDDTGTPGDRITQDNTLQIVGSARSGALVMVFVDGVPVGSVVAASNGNWTFNAPALTDGNRTFTASQSDAAGNVSPASPPYTVSIDTAVAPPIIDTVGTDTGASSTDRLTADKTLEITGRAEPGAKVEVHINGNVVGTAIASGSGIWTLTTPELDEGVKSITATQTDVAGNVSVASPPYTITIDATAMAPTIDSVGSDTGVLGDRITSDNTLEIKGKAEAGATVFVTIDGASVGDVVADSSGNWTFVTAALPDGLKTIRVSQIDLAGNMSPPSPPYMMLVDTTAVDSNDLRAPLIAEMADGKINAAEAADGTVVSIPGYVGMTVGDTVTMNWNGINFSHVVTAADVSIGHVLITVPRASIANGSFTVDYTVTDAGGNASGRSPATPVVVNMQPPPSSNLPFNDNARDPEVTLLADGGWVISWWRMTSANGFSYFHLYQTRFDASGHAMGSPILVDGFGPGGGALKMETVALPNGGWATMYMLTASAPTMAAFIQKFTANGAKDGGRIPCGTRDIECMEVLPNGELVYMADGALVKLDAQGNEVWRTNPGLSVGTFEVLANGGIVYSGKAPAPDGRAMLRFYNADGTPGAEIIVSSGAVNANYGVQIEKLTGGGYAVVWSEGTSTYQRRLFADGSPVGGSSLVKANRVLAEMEPLQDGGWVITCMDSTHRNAYFQRFDSAGVAVGGETLIGSAAYWISKPDIEATPDGGFLVTWSKSDGGNTSKGFQQRYDSNGDKVALDGSTVTVLMTQDVEATVDVASHAIDEAHGPQVPTGDAAALVAPTAPASLNGRDETPPELMPELTAPAQASNAGASDMQAAAQVFAAISANDVQGIHASGLEALGMQGEHSPADASRSLLNLHAAVWRAIQPPEDQALLSASDELPVERVFVSLTAAEQVQPLPTEHDAPVLSEVMTDLHHGRLDVLLDDVIGEPANDSSLNAPQTYSQRALAVPPKVDEFELDHDLNLH